MKMRQKVVLATLQIIAREGSSRLTFDRIGSELKIGRAHVRYHFKEMDLLIREVIFLVAQNAQSFVEVHTLKEGSPSEVLNSYVFANVAWFESHRTHALVMLDFFNRASTQAEYKELHRKIRMIGLERIEKILKGMGLSRKYQSMGAAWLQNMLTGYLLDLASAEAIPSATIKRQLKDFVSQLTKLR